MADESREVGIKLSLLVGKASKAIGGLTAATGGARKAIVALGERGGSAIKGLGATIVVANQAMELGRKALEIYRAAVVESINVALQYRDANDATVVAYKKLQKEAELVRARLGDALLPVVIAIAESVQNATGNISDWIAANRVLIGQNIVKFLSRTAEILIRVLVPVLQTVSKIWHGWVAILDTVKFAVATWAKAVIDQFTFVLGGAEKLAAAFGLDGIGKSISEARGLLNEWGKDWQDTADTAVDSIINTGAEMERLDKRLERFRAGALGAIGTATTAAMKAVERAGGGSKRSLEETQQAADKAKERMDRLSASIDSMTASRIAGIDRVAAAQERQAALTDALLARNAESTQALTDKTASLTAGFGTALGAALAAGEGIETAFASAGTAIINSILDAVEKAILAYAAQAAAAQFAAHATLPGIGIIAGASAAAAALAAVKAYVAQLPKAAEGGLVRGGQPGRDSVPALLMPGELIVPTDMTRKLMEVTGFLGDVKQRRAGGFAEGGIAASGGGGFNISVNSNFNSVAPPTETEQLAIVQRLSRGIETAFRDGLIAMPQGAS